MFQEGHYKRFSLNADFATAVFTECINNGFAVAAVKNGSIIGYLFAMKGQPMYANEWVAQECLFYLHPDHRKGRTAIKMIWMLKDWAKAEGLVEVHMGITAGIQSERTAKLYGFLGFEETGRIYRLCV